MTNWTRFFPTLLAAHRQLGAVCSRSSSKTAPAPSATRGPALAMVAAATLAWGVFSLSLPCADHPGLAQGGTPSLDSNALPVVAHTPSSDDVPAPRAHGTDVPPFTLPPAGDCPDDEPEHVFSL